MFRLILEKTRSSAVQPESWYLSSDPVGFHTLLYPSSPILSGFPKEDIDVKDKQGLCGLINGQIGFHRFRFASMIFHVKMEGVCAPELQFSVLFGHAWGVFATYIHTFS